MFVDFDANTMLAGMAIGSVGFVSFAYGKKQSRLPQMVIGVALMAFPYFVSNIPLMFGIAAGLCALLWLAVYMGL